MDREPREPDMGDDEQADEVRAYARYVEDPPEDLRIGSRDDGAEERLGISDELRQEQGRDDRDDDNRPAEAAAMHIEDDSDR